MTMTRPCRRITRHLLQIRLTLGLTFTVITSSSTPVAVRNHGTGLLVSCPELLVAIDDPPAGQVVRRQLDDDPVLGQDADVVLPHLAADVSQDLVSIGQLYPEHGVREWLDNATLDLDGSVFLRHVLRYLTSG